MKPGEEVGVEQILAAFAKLDEDARSVGYAMAWLMEPMSASNLNSRLGGAGVRRADGKRMVIADVKGAMQRLLKCGVCWRETGAALQVNLEVSHYLMAAVYGDRELLKRLVGLGTELARRGRGGAGRYGGHYGGHYGGYYGNPYSDKRTGYSKAVRDLRMCYLSGAVDDLTALAEQVRETFVEGAPWDFVLHPFEPERVKRLSDEVRSEVLDFCRWRAFACDYDCGEVLGFLLDEAATSGEWGMAAELALLRGDEVAKAAVLAGAEGGEAGEVGLQLRGGEAFLRGEDEVALALFNESRVEALKGTRKRKYCAPGVTGLWWVAALTRRGGAESVAVAKELVKWGVELGGRGEPYYLRLGYLVDQVGGADGAGLEVRLVAQAGAWLANRWQGLADVLFLGVLRMVARERVEKVEVVRALERLVERAEGVGAGWVASEAASLRDGWDGGGDGVEGFVASLRAPERWERTLRALEILAEGRPGTGGGAVAKKKAAKTKELVWHLGIHEYGWELGAVERTVSATGKVSKGRKVALRRLKEEAGQMEFLTDQDRKVASRIRLNSSWGYSEYELQDGRALVDLAGHPMVFLDGNVNRRLDLVAVRPRLSVGEGKGGKLRLELKPVMDYSEARIELVEDGVGRYQVVECTGEHVRLAAALGGLSVELPEACKERVLAAAGRLVGAVEIESDEDVSSGADVERVQGETMPVVRLQRWEDGVAAELVVRPLADGENVYRPGEGKRVVMLGHGGRAVCVERDLAVEKERAAAVREGCGAFDDESEWSVRLGSVEAALGLLADLRVLGGEQVCVEWPQGEELQVRGVATVKQFSLKLGGSGEWLTASGELKVDEEMVLTLRELMALSAASGGPAGFVRLEDGQFLALEAGLRRQLEDLGAFSQAGSGKAVKIHPVAVLALEELAVGERVKVGAAWKKQLAKLAASREEAPAVVPSTLRAELRPYQVEGYQWMRRLAGWGMGACLADDMGLGKTVQALALLVERAGEGAALVVAPTSVVANWAEEAAKFAPTLNVIVLGDQGDGRREAVEGAGAFDLVVASYGLLQTEAELLQAAKWGTLVLDEAQAVKNRETKRWKAAVKLEAGFRLATTGTPVENHLGELYSLFQFLNPGLLGSWERFRVVFADPIEKGNDAGARGRLRRLVGPFILRRLKSAVLKDLPARTEVVLRVELDGEEAAFYEALRRKEVEEIEESGEEGEVPGGGAIRMLAALTRLRRACCHPKLVDAESMVGGAKLRVFGEKLEEVLGGGHKVLVFSQFVGHLTILREYLDGIGVGYHYLDGSTPAKKRQASVKAFQGGERDVFLISLKAGGSGINLTAADCVIHMDPWWNPAVEDQASDRAHRIGQDRAVTVYRLVTAGTIEEKILELHHRKRELADSILEGTDSAGRLSAEELLGLLRGDF